MSVMAIYRQSSCSDAGTHSTPSKTIDFSIPFVKGSEEVYECCALPKRKQTEVGTGFTLRSLNRKAGVSVYDLGVSCLVARVSEILPRNVSGDNRPSSQLGRVRGLS
jgi:hypothetical protein